MNEDWYVIVATGPSRCNEDTKRFRNFARVVAVNCAVFYVPWAYALFAGDTIWWRYYGAKITWFKGRRISRSASLATVERWRGNWPRTGGNSGHMAIQWAVDDGAKKVALIGFDHQLTNGTAHCHADHPKYTKDGARTNMANAGGIIAWPRHMAATARDLAERGVRVVNLSRETAIKCFPCLTVEQFLETVDG